MHRLLESTLLCHKSSSPKRRDLEVPFHAFQTDTIYVVVLLLMKQHLFLPLYLDLFATANLYKLRLVLLRVSVTRPMARVVPLCVRPKQRLFFWVVRAAATAAATVEKWVDFGKLRQKEARELAQQQFEKRMRHLGVQKINDSCSSLWCCLSFDEKIVV